MENTEKSTFEVGHDVQYPVIATIYNMATDVQKIDIFANADKYEPGAGVIIHNKDVARKSEKYCLCLMKLFRHNIFDIMSYGYYANGRKEMYITHFCAGSYYPDKLDIVFHHRHDESIEFEVPYMFGMYVRLFPSSEAKRTAEENEKYYKDREGRPYNLQYCVEINNTAEEPVVVDLTKPHPDMKVHIDNREQLAGKYELLRVVTKNKRQFKKGISGVCENIHEHRYPHQQEFIIDVDLKPNQEYLTSPTMVEVLPNTKVIYQLLGENNIPHGFGSLHINDDITIESIDDYRQKYASLKKEYDEKISKTPDIKIAEEYKQRIAILNQYPLFYAKYKKGQYVILSPEKSNLSIIRIIGSEEKINGTHGFKSVYDEVSGIMLCVRIEDVTVSDDGSGEVVYVSEIQKSWFRHSDGRTREQTSMICSTHHLEKDVIGVLEEDAITPSK